MTKVDKAQCLKKINFSSSTVVDIKNIKKTTYSKKLEFSQITNEKIYQTVIKASSNKTSKNNDIFNRISKTVLSQIVFTLKYIFNTNFTLKYCFNHFKKSIIVLCKKLDKSNYFIFKVYKSIIFLNIMSKIMKIIMTTKLSHAIEKHDLLSRCQFEIKKKTFHRTRFTFHHETNSFDLNRWKNRNRVIDERHWNLRQRLLFQILSQFEKTTYRKQKFKLNRQLSFRKIHDT